MKTNKQEGLSIPNSKNRKILLATLIPCLIAGVGVGCGLGVYYYMLKKSTKNKTPYFTTHVTSDTLKDNGDGNAVIRIDLYNGMKFNELDFDDNNNGFYAATDDTQQTFTITGIAPVGDHDVKIIGNNHSQDVGIHVDSSLTPIPTLSATVNGSLKIGVSKTAAIKVTGTNGANTSSLIATGYDPNKLTIGKFTTSGVAIVRLGTSPAAGNYIITITNGSQSTTCQVTVEQQIGVTPTKLVIDGVNNQSITIHTTFNLEGTYQFYCHDDAGGNPTNVKWTKTPNSLIIINETSGLLSWTNNLDPNTTNNFVLTCSNGSLTDAVCNVSVVIDQIPGNDICPNSWLEVSAGEISLKSGVDKKRIHKLVIPSKLAGDDVATIGYGGFDQCEFLTSVTIPDSVTSIDTNAFNYCTSLTSITFSNTLAAIGQAAFNNCTSLKSITFPNSLESINTKAFASCTSLTFITLPSSLTTIRDSAFDGCSSLSSITASYAGSQGLFFSSTAFSNIATAGTVKNTNQNYPSSAFLAFLQTKGLPTIGWTATT